MTRRKLPRPERPSLDEHRDHPSLARARSSLSANLGRHLAVTGCRGLCFSAHAHVMRIRVRRNASPFFHVRFLCEAFASRGGSNAGPSFTRIRTPRFSDAAPMARFSNLSVAGPTATHRLLQHKPTYGHGFELLILAAATGAKPPTAPLPFTRSLARANDRAREASIAFTCGESDPTYGHLAAAQRREGREASSEGR